MKNYLNNSDFPNPSPLERGWGEVKKTVNACTNRHI